MTFDQALDLLQKHGIEPQRVEHSIGVSETAFDIAQKISLEHPDLGIDPERVRLGGLLHDIGRSRPGDHEVNSQTILHEEGLPEIAAIVMHGSLYEASELRGHPNLSFLPQGIENKIVAYADARFRLAPVTLLERFDEILRRRAHEPEKVAAIHRARARFKQLEGELLHLMQ